MPDVTRRIAISVGVGGGGGKCGAAHIATGQLVGARRRVATPQPSTPAAVVGVIARLVERIGREAGAPGAPVGVGVPSVVIEGVTKTAANIDPTWIGFDAGRAPGASLGRPVVVLNDAAAAGIAEMRFGAGVGKAGTGFVLTLL